MIDKDLQKITEDFDYVINRGYMYIVRPITTIERMNHPMPNFLGQKVALVGIAHRNETFDEFKKRWITTRILHDTH